MITNDKLLKGLSILVALRQNGLRIGDVAKAAGFERKWLSRRIYGQVTPTDADLDQIAAIIGIERTFFRHHFRRPLSERQAVVQ